MQEQQALLVGQRQSSRFEYLGYIFASIARQSLVCATVEDFATSVIDRRAGFGTGATIIDRRVRRIYSLSTASTDTTKLVKGCCLCRTLCKFLRCYDSSAVLNETDYAYPPSHHCARMISSGLVYPAAMYASPHQAVSCPIEAI